MTQRLSATILAFSVLLCISSVNSFAQSTDIARNDSVKIQYHKVLDTIVSMLEEKTPASFKEAVFAVENAYLDGTLSKELFQQDLDLLTGLASQIIQNRQLTYSGSDKSNVEVHAALFTVMTDTLHVRWPNNVNLRHMPFRYDFEDVFGRSSWTQMFVSKLLATRTGNCHSLPYLYKILAEEMDVPAHLALAPNHVYIKLRNEESGWYNTELTSGQFPIDAWLMASGYVHMDAIHNSIFMDTLSTRQSLALTLVDLAKGYQRKTQNTDPEFVLHITEKALEYDTTSINALLLKAELLKERLQRQMENNGIEEIGNIVTDSPMESLFSEMQNLYGYIHQIGYRQMPESMYLDWLQSLQAEHEKYTNRNLPYSNN